MGHTNELLAQIESLKKEKEDLKDRVNEVESWLGEPLTDWNEPLKPTYKSLEKQNEELKQMYKELYDNTFFEEKLHTETCLKHFHFYNDLKKDD
jgi:uncharacterized coiled-coil DUF342 family protein